jgi:hypothetical protein
MSYLELLPSMVSGQPKLFQMAVDGTIRKHTIINIIITGIVFGISNIIGVIANDPGALPMSGKYAVIIPLLFSLYGIMTILGALAGFCLVYWAAAKAFGGPGGFNLIVDLLGMSAVPFWILAPLLNYWLRFRGTESLTLALLLPLAAAFVWSFKLLRQSLVTGQGLAEGRATLALGCIWIFSISAVYVFMP